MPVSPEIRDAARTLELIAEPTRLQVLCLLRDAPGGEMNVTEMIGAVGISQPALSHHLALLRTAGLVETRRDGKFNHYSIRPGALAAVAGFVASLGGDEAAHGNEAAHGGGGNGKGGRGWAVAAVG
jgi:ArsR family transcriptional regulator